MPASPSDGARLFAAFAILGYAALGVGLTMVLGGLSGGLLVGLAVAAAGLGLALAGRVAPRVAFPPAAAAGLGVTLLVSVIMHGALAQAPFDLRRLLLAGLGLALMLAAPFMRHEVSTPRGGIRVSAFAACAAALLGVPLVAWAFFAA